MTALLWIVGVAGALLLALYALQDRLLYFPAPMSQQAVPVEGLRPWPSVEDFRGWVAEPPGGAHRTTVVFHGNAGHAAHRAF